MLLRLVTSTTLAVVLWTLLVEVLSPAGTRCVAGKACGQCATVHSQELGMGHRLYLPPFGYRKHTYQEVELFNISMPGPLNFIQYIL